MKHYVTAIERNTMTKAELEAERIGLAVAYLNPQTYGVARLIAQRQIAKQVKEICDRVDRLMGK